MGEKVEHVLHFEQDPEWEDYTLLRIIYYWRDGQRWEHDITDRVHNLNVKEMVEWVAEFGSWWADTVEIHTPQVDIGGGY